MLGRRSREVSLVVGTAASAAMAGKGVRSGGVGRMMSLSSGSTSRRCCQRRKPNRPASRTSRPAAAHQKRVTRPMTESSIETGSGSSTAGVAGRGRAGAGVAATGGASTAGAATSGTGAASVAATPGSAIGAAIGAGGAAAAGGGVAGTTAVPVPASLACRAAISADRSSSWRRDSVRSRSRDPSRSRRAFISAGSPAAAPLAAAVPGVVSVGGTRRRRPAPSSVADVSAPRLRHSTPWRRTSATAASREMDVMSADSGRRSTEPARRSLMVPSNARGLAR